MKFLPLATLAFTLAAPLCAQDAAAPAATPAEQVTVPPGFQIELLKSATKAEGSWVSMAIDDQGRLYISPQGAVPESGFKKESAWGGLWRATLDAQGHVAKWEKVPVPVGDAMGMLWAFDSLYVSGQGPEGRAIYRVKDTNGDDTLDEAKLWKAVPGGNGEHGAHALVLGPDGKSIYIAHGNATPLIEGIDAQSPYRNYAEDILIPRVMDPVATFFDKLKIPYGQILRTDENGTRWELFAGGFRNEYDIDFNADGELFTYDSDMEWDVGLPWYRPTRVLHIIPGAEFGFREGNQKWPESYADSLPAVTNIGMGCPTGVKFGTKSNFPERYKRAFFIMDWTFGRLLAVQLHPEGASYSAQNPLKSYTHPTGPEASEDVEVFLSGKGMPLTDLEFGMDGAMYLTVGGRGTQAGLYRVSWIDGKNTKKEVDIGLTAPVNARREEFNNEEATAARETVARMKDHANSRYAVDEAWPLLGSEDRFSSFPARLMLEDMSVGAWGEKALAETNPRTALAALLTLARVGAKDLQAPLLKALARFPLDSLDEDLRLLELRVIKVSFARQGRPDTDLVNLAVERLGTQYPAASWPLNRELCELLIWLGAPEAIEKTLGLLESSASPEEQTWYACMLREAQGWTPAQRERYFAWFPTGRNYFGGNSRKKFVEKIQELALAQVPAAERAHFAELASKAEAGKITQPAVLRQFQKSWTMADLEPELPKAASGRDFARGKEIFASVQCLACHHFGPAGGNVGPDLSAVGQRFQRRDILEAIVEPSKVISEQYASFIFTMKNGEAYVGQVAAESNYHYDVIVDSIRGEHRQVGKTGLEKKEISPVSLMPPGLINVLTKEEILDLLAYLESGGNEKARAFAK